MDRNWTETTGTKAQLLVASWCEELGLRCILEERVSVYSLDIYLPEIRLGIELDGPYHRKKRDEKRDSFIKRRYNIDIIRFKNKEIDEMNKEDFFVLIEQRAVEYEN